MGTRIRFETNPGASLTSTGVFPRSKLSVSMALYTSSLVAKPRMTSTSFMIGTGFIKCIPMTLSGLLVHEPISVIGIEDVLLANIVFASNTSSIPITEIGSCTKRPDRVIGMHFMNPVPIMKLVEVIRGLATSDEVYKAIETLSLDLGKTPVEVNDAPGFVSNRILVPMLNEAVRTLYRGIASVEAIDNVMKLGMNHPMGPLALADLIGLDTVLSIMETLHQNLGEAYRPCPLLRKYVK